MNRKHQQYLAIAMLSLILYGVWPHEMFETSTEPIDGEVTLAASQKALSKTSVSPDSSTEKTLSIDAGPEPTRWELDQILDNVAMLQKSPSTAVVQSNQPKSSQVVAVYLSGQRDRATALVGKQIVRVGGQLNQNQQVLGIDDNGIQLGQ